jgi:hypothetical protein
MLPFLVLPAAAGPWIWAGLLYGAFVGGLLAIPVRREIRWLTLLVFGLSWPFVYSLKLGQVGPLLVLSFALGWRWLDRQVPLGLTIAFGTIVKVQPVLLIGWAAVTRRWTAAFVAVTVLAAAAILVVPLVGIEAWPDFVTILLRVSRPITTDHNFAPGAILYQLGLDEAMASVVQAASTLSALAAMGWSWFRRDATCGYLATVIVSQLISPILWEHYAIVLALPVAFLMARRHWWAVVIPLLMAWPLIGLTPPIAYPIAFWVVLLAVIVVGDPRSSEGPGAVPARADPDA